MRSRAEAATPGPWFADDLYATVTAAPYRSARAAYDRRTSDERVWVVPESMDSSVDGDDLAHIASWHPLVALAVADWLEVEADEADRYSGEGAPQVCCGRGYRDAVAVARAYLGGVS